MSDRRPQSGKLRFQRGGGALSPFKLPFGQTGSLALKAVSRSAAAKRRYDAASPGAAADAEARDAEEADAVAQAARAGAGVSPVVPGDL